MNVPIVGPAQTFRDIGSRLSALGSSIAAGWSVAHHPNGRHKFEWTSIDRTLLSSVVSGGTMTVTFDPTNANQSFNYVDLGGTMALAAHFFNLTLGGTATGILKLNLPPGYIVDKFCGGSYVVLTAGADLPSAVWTAAKGQGYINLFQGTASTNWTLGAGTYFWINAVIPVTRPTSSPS